MSAAEAVLLQNVPPQASSKSMIAVLGGISLLSGLLIAVVYQATLPTIKLNQQRMLEQAVFEVLPGATARTTFTIGADGTLTAVQGEAPSGVRRVYAGYRDGELAGVAVEASGQGYQDIIRVIYGIDPAKQSVIGFKVLESKETPGLGDKIITDPHFLANFEALDISLNGEGTGLANAIEVVKPGEKENPWQIDGISGATISSKAVGAMLDASAQEMASYLQKHLAELKAGAP